MCVVVEEAVSVIKDAVAWTRSTPPTPNRMADFDKLLPAGQAQAICRPGGGLPLSASWKSPPMRCTHHLAAWTPRSNTCRSGEKRQRGLYAACRPPTCCCSTNQTNHLDADSVAWLEHFLHDFPGTVVAITHDRYFLDNVAGWILELDRGAGIPYEGNYSGWLEAKSDAVWPPNPSSNRPTKKP